MSLLLRLDDTDVRPLYEQIAAAVRGALVDGRLRPGDRLPSGRDVAESSGVTLETVQRAYRLLADEGLVTSRVGRGTAVAGDVDVASLTVEPEVDRVIARAREVGMDADDVIAAIHRRWQV